MEDLIEAIKSNDLVAVRKAFSTLMTEKKTSLIEERKVEIARSVMIEGEEAEDDEDDEDEDKDEDDKSDKDGKSDKSDKKPGKDDKEEE